MSNHQGYVQRFFDGVWKEGRAALIDDLVSPECVIHGLGEKMIGNQPFKAFHAGFSATFQDIHLRVEEELIDGDRVAFRASFEARHRKSGRPVAMSGGGVIKLINGRIVEAWNVWDFLGLLQQTGEVAPDAFQRLLS